MPLRTLLIIAEFGIVPRFSFLVPRFTAEGAEEKRKKQNVLGRWSLTRPGAKRTEPRRRGRLMSLTCEDLERL